MAASSTGSTRCCSACRPRTTSAGCSTSSDRADPSPGTRRTMADQVLSVVMPCFNEQATVATAAKRVLDSPWVKQLVVVDDCSTDGSRQQLEGIDDPRLTVIAH